jgi:hypothetical protein
MGKGIKESLMRLDMLNMECLSDLELNTRK